MVRLWTPKAQADRAMLLSWAEERLSSTVFSRNGTALPGKEVGSGALPVAVMRGDKIAAVIIYHQHRGASLEMTNAADTPRWATKGVIAELLSYPFEVLGCRRIEAIVRADNVRARRFDEGIGFEQEGIMREKFEDCDGIMYSLTKRDWLGSRWHRIWQDRHAIQEEAA
ncbi:MAG TPA: GNAT family protein [Methyloceanibacter sp.]|nr:GNAT family protein [Methyloceanibacter sp.]